MLDLLRRSARKTDSRGPIRPIEDHGVIGDLRTMALVGKDGAIDFLCAPQFDSPSIFAALLDPGAGHFAVTPRNDHPADLSALSARHQRADDSLHVRRGHC